MTAIYISAAVKANCWTMRARCGMLGVIWTRMVNSAPCFATAKGDYYSLVGMQLDNYRIRNDVQFIYLLAIPQAYDPSYDFTKNGIPKEVIDDVKKNLNRIKIESFC